MWPWSEIKKLRELLQEEAMRGDKDRKFLRDKRDEALKMAYDLAVVVEQQAGEIDTMRATISTLRKTGIIVNVQEGKR